MTSNSLSKQDVLDRAEHLDFPQSVIEFFQGQLGQPYGGFPEPLRTHVIRNKPKIDGRPGASLPPMDFRKMKADLRAKFGKHITDVDVASYAMYPKVCHCVMVVDSELNQNTGLRGVSTLRREVW